MSDVTMPQLGESVTEGTITRWFKQPGDEVAEDEVLLEVSTDKVDTEVPSPIAGTVQELRAAEGDTVDVGTVIAVVGEGAAPSGPTRTPAAARKRRPPSPRWRRPASRSPNLSRRTRPKPRRPRLMRQPSPKRSSREKSPSRRHPAARPSRRVRRPRRATVACCCRRSFVGCWTGPTSTPPR